MAGLVPAIHAVAAGADAGRPGHHHDQPPQRHPRHRRHLRYRPSSLRTSRKFSEGFTKRYGVKRLVYRELHETIAGGDPARVEHEALAARLKGTANCELQSRLARLV
jgi:hypothetical protein